MPNAPKSITQLVREGNKVNRRDARREKRQKKANRDSSQLSEATIGSTRSGTGNVQTGNQNPAPNPSGNSGGGGGGGQRPAGPLDDVPTVVPRSPVWGDVEPSRYGDFYADPSLARNMWMQANGIDPMNAGGMTRVLDDLAQYAPALWKLTQLGGQGEQDIDFAQFLDFADQFLNTYTRSANEGGGIYDPSVVGNMFGNLDGTALGTVLNNPALDPSQQVNQVMGLLQGGLGTSVPSDILSAIMSSAEEAGKGFSANQRTGGGTFIDYLRNSDIGNLLTRLR